ncbi:hypothetical protein ACJJIE_11560 [Microbulbifer sp. TRSA001]|uniref:hypothetical protein n=1 Tax=unclassified Microbulbifer TaxID=2619833 RepID=UPI0024AE359D|nr:hypothetical protein [Microbulbifer sp. VAAF005]WHI45935.1 hypothetical protein P0078_19785 [Microbulbifer sp. VAAF005]
MLIEEIGVGIFGAIFRFLGWVLFEVIIEVLIKGLGYLICRPFKKVNIDDAFCIVLGLIAWVVILISVMLVTDWVSKNTDIDSCLDDGGRFNYQSSICEYE